jgi:phospholipid/cholesterol/gamma-HCH transport system permease protein
MLLWRAWGRALPAVVDQAGTLAGIRTHRPPITSRARRSPAIAPARRDGGRLGGRSASVRHLVDFVALIGQFALNLVHVMRNPADLPRREISANLYKSGVRAMPVTALVGFLIGVVLSYLSALQLKQFGADIFIVNIIGLGIVRELGPVLVAILVAGRSGSAMTAQLGVMRVTEEIDALATMGVRAACA